MPEAERDFYAALRPNGPALFAYQRLGPSHQREFVAFVVEGPLREVSLRIGEAVGILAEAA
jgi:hypothetical protein